VEGAETRAPTPFLLDTQFSNASSADLSKSSAASSKARPRRPRRCLGLPGTRLRGIRTAARLPAAPHSSECRSLLHTCRRRTCRSRARRRSSRRERAGRRSQKGQAIPLASGRLPRHPRTLAHAGDPASLYDCAYDREQLRHLPQHRRKRDRPSGRAGGGRIPACRYRPGGAGGGGGAAGTQIHA